VAAKGAARRMAATLGQPVGGTVGYRVRLDSKVGAGRPPVGCASGAVPRSMHRGGASSRSQVSAATRIEVVTEGILLRRLQVCARPGFHLNAKCVCSVRQVCPSVTDASLFIQPKFGWSYFSNGWAT
jgi:hypothetical protein